MPRIPRPTPPRGLIFLASAWLMISWALTIGVRPPVQLHAASYTPAVRLLLLSIMSGIVFAWPLVRLSGGLRAWPIRQALLDLVVLLCLVQVVIWPLRLVTSWSPARSAVIDVCLIGWATAVAALISIGSIPARRGIHTLRTVAMAVITLVALGVPAAELLSGESLPFSGPPPLGASGEWWMKASASPLTAMDALTGGGPNRPTELEWEAALRGWWVAAALWLVALLAHPIVPRLDANPDANPDGNPTGNPDARSEDPEDGESDEGNVKPDEDASGRG